MRRVTLERVKLLPLAVAIGVLLAASGVGAEQVPAAVSPAAVGSEVAPQGSDAAPEGAGTAAPTPEAPVRPVGDPATGATKAAICGGCHGPDGNALAPMFPKLAGQRLDYVSKQLRDFKAGRRVDPVMAGMAAMLSDQDIEDVAAHFESRTVQVGAGDPELAAAGELIYRNGRPESGLFPCIGCHGPNGEGANGAIDGGFPAVGGQHPDYLAKQLQGFRDGARSNDWKGIMQLVANRMTDEDVAAVIAYLVALPRIPDSTASR